MPKMVTPAVGTPALSRTRGEDTSALPGPPRLAAAEQTHQQPDREVDDQQRGEREIKTEVPPLDRDVTGQTAKPEPGDQRPCQAEHDQDESQQDEGSRNRVHATSP